jgi:GTP-binding protein HflX
MSTRPSALLITYTFEGAMKEATSLADAAGYSIKKTISQRHITRSRYGIGEGKAEEVKKLAEQLRPEVIIFDEILKPSQQYNLAKLCKVEIIDRERLILEIFERRASTAESRIQIRLAQLRYEMIRAKQKVRLAKAGEQPGFYGLGKYDADVHFLDIKRRAVVLNKKLAKEEVRRSLYRNQRAKAGLPTVSIAGYTSAGKTTLFNILTGEAKIVGGGMFTTLSTFTRSINSKYGRFLISDTVGFISRLPAYMIDAFKSTLQELTHSALILLVLDISEPIEEVLIKLDSSIKVMNDLGVLMTKVIYVVNKVDLTNPKDAFEKSARLGIVDSGVRVVMVSAKTGYGIDRLRDMITYFVIPQENLKPIKI